MFHNHQTAKAFLEKHLGWTFWIWHRLIPLYEIGHNAEQNYYLLTDVMKHRCAFAAPLKLVDELIQNRPTKKPGAPLQSYVIDTNVNFIHTIMCTTPVSALVGHAAIGKSEFEVPSESKYYVAVRHGFRPKSATSISFLRTCHNRFELLMLCAWQEAI